MMLTPYQHGIVRVIKEQGYWSPYDPQFQDYAFIIRDIEELKQAKVITHKNNINGDARYIAGVNYEKA